MGSGFQRLLVVGKVTVITTLICFVLQCLVNVMRARFFSVRPEAGDIGEDSLSESDVEDFDRFRMAMIVRLLERM